MPKYTYILDICYRDKNFDKEFMERTVIAQTDEKAIELGKAFRRNIVNVVIKSKTPL